VRRTSSRLGLRTDALARFEKSLGPGPGGAGPAPLRPAAGRDEPLGEDRAQLPGGRAARAPERRIELDAALVRSRLGGPVADAEIELTLRAAGFDPHAHGAGRWDGGRAGLARDARRDDPEDLVEEVGRLLGYDRVPTVVPRGPLRAGRRDPVLDVEDRLRDALAVRQAFTESISYSMVTDAALAAAGWTSGQAAALPRLRNPLQQMPLACGPRPFRACWSGSRLAAARRAATRLRRRARDTPWVPMASSPRRARSWRCWPGRARAMRATWCASCAAWPTRPLAALGYTASSARRGSRTPASRGSTRVSPPS
jgi:hypothetical protein